MSIGEGCDGWLSDGTSNRTMASVADGDFGRLVLPSGEGTVVVSGTSSSVNNFGCFFGIGDRDFTSTEEAFSSVNFASAVFARTASGAVVLSGLVDLYFVVFGAAVVGRDCSAAALVDLLLRAVSGTALLVCGRTASPEDILGVFR